MSLEDASADALCTSGLPDLSVAPQLIKECARVVRNGGSVIVATAVGIVGRGPERHVLTAMFMHAGLVGITQQLSRGTAMTAAAFVADAAIVGARGVEPVGAGVAIEEVRAAIDTAWQAAAVEVLLAGGWRDQITAAAAIALSDRPLSDDPLCAALWRAIDGASWVAPQLVAAALIADPKFETRAADRLADAARRAPKTIGALVRAYTRCPARRMQVMAQLAITTGRWRPKRRASACAASTAGSTTLAARRRRPLRARADRDTRA